MSLAHVTEACLAFLGRHQWLHGAGICHAPQCFCRVTPDLRVYIGQESDEWLGRPRVAHVVERQRRACPRRRVVVTQGVDESVDVSLLPESRDGRRAKQGHRRHLPTHVYGSGMPYGRLNRVRFISPNTDASRPSREARCRAEGVGLIEDPVVLAIESGAHRARNGCAGAIHERGRRAPP
jgi:hypothetical protein